MMMSECGGKLLSNLRFIRVLAGRGWAKQQTLLRLSVERLWNRNLPNTTRKC